MHINMIIDSTKHPKNLKECNCLPTCSMIEYEVTDTSNVDDWNYMKSINLVQNKYVSIHEYFSFFYILFIYPIHYFHLYSTPKQIVNLKCTYKSLFNQTHTPAHITHIYSHYIHTYVIHTYIHTRIYTYTYIYTHNINL